MLASSSLIADIESIATDQVLNNHNLHNHHFLYSRFLFWSRKSSFRETLQTESQKKTSRSLKCTKTTYETRSDTLIDAFQKKKKKILFQQQKGSAFQALQSLLSFQFESKLLRNCSDLVWNRIAVAGIESCRLRWQWKKTPLKVGSEDPRSGSRWDRPRNWNLGFCDRVFRVFGFSTERERERDYFRVRTLTRGGSGAGLVMHRGNRLWAPPVGPVLARAPPVWPTLGTSRRHPKSQPLAERMSKWVPT